MGGGLLGFRKQVKKFVASRRESKRKKDYDLTLLRFSLFLLTSKIAGAHDAALPAGRRRRRRTAALEDGAMLHHRHPERGRRRVCDHGRDADKGGRGRRGGRRWHRRGGRRGRECARAAPGAALPPTPPSHRVARQACHRAAWWVSQPRRWCRVAALRRWGLRSPLPQLRHDSSPFYHLPHTRTHAP